MPIRNYLPFGNRKPIRLELETAIVEATPEKLPSRQDWKPRGVAMGVPGFSITARANFEIAPYDFQRIIQAIDTDSYIKQAFFKHQDLMWKEGWDIIAENVDAVDYLYQRLDYIEQAMEKSFQDFLSEASDQLFKFSNVFIAKVRAPQTYPFPRPLRGLQDKDPIIGYEILPTEAMEIQRDSFNNPLKYKQRITTETAFEVFNARSKAITEPEWFPDEIIHLTIDRKPGRIFGTPFLTSVMDDIVALRQIEEDIENLIHQELFPLYTYRVGTELSPAEENELTAAADALADLRSEGGLVIPERHEVAVLGAEGNALDAENYLNHFKQRVAIGLGMSPHHLGMVMNGGNRSVTDRLDIALYDRIKKYQKSLSESVRFGIFNELLYEAGFEPIQNPHAKGMSDRCDFKFNEIDVDTQAKTDNQVIQKYTAGVITLAEARIMLRMSPDADETQLVTHINAAIAAKFAPPPPPAAPGAPAKPAPPRPTQILPTPAAKTSKNIAMPRNQHGTRTSPNIRHTDIDVDPLIALLMEDEETDE